MKMAMLSAAQAKAMMMAVAQTVIENKEFLCDADRNIGDGDHGIGMANGFEAAYNELSSKDFTDVYQVFSTVGRTMIKVMGGASGIIFGLLFYAGAKNMPPKEAITQQEFAELFNKACLEIQAKGQARLGDKTLIDGLVPMVEAMQISAANGESWHTMLETAYQATEQGKEASKNFIAKHGKAKTLGERALGYPDAGCVSLTVILRAMRDWAENNH
jgi:dihydroxyacetone kinase phosphoprotein-dependent L subunit